MNSIPASTMRAQGKFLNPGMGCVRCLIQDVNFTKRPVFESTRDQLIGHPDGRFDLADAIAQMVEIVPADEGRFRNVVPLERVARLKQHQAEMWDRPL